MPEDSNKFTILWKRRMSEIDRDAWDSLALPLKTPILEWEWLRLLEDSGSIVPERGWLPLHLTIWSGDRLAAAAPLYIRSHSMGDFVFDYMWADAAEQLGIEYYPKMIGMSPVTPVEGYRFLIAPEQDEQQLTAVMMKAIDTFCRRNKIASLSFHYVDPTWREQIETLGFTVWQHQSYLWTNPGLESFEGYLQLFNKNQRRNIRRERRQMVSQGIRIRPFRGDEIPEGFFPKMYAFYQRTNDQFGPWAAKYLTRDFFLGLTPAFRRRLLLLAAFTESDPAEPIGMSFLLIKGDRLWGRYWGSSGWYDSLHFNACYYSPIEWAIGNRIKSFDPGIGSTHKLRRGFRAVTNYSLHRLYDDRLRALMEMNIDRINRSEQQQVDELNRALPLIQ